MKWAKEVIELMSAYPSREFRMIEIVRYCCPNPKDQKERRAVHRGVHRVVEGLQDTGSVTVGRASRNGGYGTYRWR